MIYNNDMTRINNIPPYAEEQTIDQEQLSIQQILAQFQQPTPSNFAKLGQPKKYWGSTEGLDKPLCERYTLKHDNKTITLDITQELSNKLKLTPEDNFYVVPEVLARSIEEGGITVDKEKEIFIQRPLTINNLTSTLQGWITEIEQLKNEKEISRETISNLETERSNLVNQINQLETLLTEIGTNSQTQITQLKDWKRQIKLDLVPLFWPQAFYTEDTPSAETLAEEIKKLVLEKEKMENESGQLNNDWQTTRTQLTAANTLITNLQNLLGIDLNNLPQIPSGETLASLLERPTSADLQTERNRANNSENRANGLERENNTLKVEKNNIQTQRDNRPNITLSQWNNDYSRRPTQQQLTNLQNELNNLRTELNNTKNERDNYRDRWNNHSCSCSCPTVEEIARGILNGDYEEYFDF